MNNLLDAFDSWHAAFVALLKGAAKSVVCMQCEAIRVGSCRLKLSPEEIECPLHERYHEAEWGIYEALSALTWGFDPPGGYDTGEHDG